jgi:ubiquinone/menaquinone biosynthesis C-methylase UbiE
MRIVGCAEFMPFDDAQFDGIVFATSLDHVCSIEKTIDECYRTLTIGGRILIWMSDRSRPSFLVRIKQWLNQRKYNWKKGYRADKFVVFPNWTVLHVPDGAVDPFHSFNEAPKEIISLMKAQGFKHDDIAYNNPNEIFLCFSKVSETSD